MRHRPPTSTHRGAWHAAAAMLLGLSMLLGPSLAPPPAHAMIAVSAIREVIRAARPRFAQCAEGTPVLVATRIAVAFTIGADGRVAEADVREVDPSAAPLAECIARVLLSLVFPANDRGAITRVSYPFYFEPSG